MDHVLGDLWPNSQPPMAFTADDGRKLTRTVRTYGIVESDGAGETNIAHLDPVMLADGVTIDEDAFYFRGRLFRATPA